MKMSSQQLLFVVAASLVALPPGAAASKPAAAARDGSAVLLAASVSQPQALPGSGGGLDVLRENEEGGEASLYRPWKTRFDLQPYDLTSPKFMRPENRVGYRRFYAANPQTALAPNSRDRQAQTTVEMMFGLTSLGAIVGGLLIVDQMQVTEMDQLDRTRYQVKMIKMIAFAAVPWLMLCGWLMSLFFAFVLNPMRYPGGHYHWQCSAMVWFLVVASLVNTVYFTVHAIWVSRLFFAVDKQAPMGKMFSLAREMEAMSGNDKLSRFLDFATSQVVRYVLVLLEAACAILGFMLITFRWGANSQYCQPEVYWATYALVATIAILVVFTALAFIGSVLIRVCSWSPWVDDFVGSFWEAERIAAYEKHEKKVAKELAKSKKAAADAEYEEEFDEWYEIQQELEEEREKHRQINDGHEEYKEAISEPAPTRQKKLALDGPDQEAEEEPGTVKGDDDDGDASTAPPSVAAVEWPQDSSGAYNMSGSSRVLAGAEAQLQQARASGRVLGTRPLAADRVEQAESSQAPIIPESLNSSVLYSGSHPNWASQGFASPFAQAPPSAPLPGTFSQVPISSVAMAPPMGSRTAFLDAAPPGFIPAPPSVRFVDELDGSLQLAPGTPPSTLPPGSLPPLEAVPADLIGQTFEWGGSLNGSLRSIPPGSFASPMSLPTVALNGVPVSGPGFAPPSASAPPLMVPPSGPMPTTPPSGPLPSSLAI